MRGYSAGLQEWIEAFSFYHFLRHDKIISFDDVTKQLKFEEPLFPNDKDKDNSDVQTDLEKDNPSDLVIEPVETLTVTVPQSEFILGIADLTGELMRNAINALGAGNMEVRDE